MKTQAIVLALLLCTQSCRTIRHDYSGDKLMTPGTILTGDAADLGTIQGSKKAWYLLFGLIPLNDSSGVELAEDLANDSYGSDYDGISHIRIREEAGFWDEFLRIVTLGLVSTMTVEVEGKGRRLLGGRR